MSPLRKASETESTKRTDQWGSLRFFAGTEYSNTPSISLARVIIKRGQRNPRHSHPSCDEILYLLTGKLKHFVGAEGYDMSAGDSIAIPAGVPHYAINTGDEDADMIVAYSTGARDFKLEPEE